MSPVGVQDKIEVFSGFVIVLSLNHEGCEEKAHFNIHLTTGTFDCLVKALFSLDLQAVTKAELSKLLPFISIVRRINEMVHEIFLSILNVTNGIKLKSESVKFFGRCLTEACIVLVIARSSDVFKLRDDVGVQIVPLCRKDSLLEASLHFGLEENIQLRLQLVLLAGRKRCGTGLFLDHLSSNPKYGLLKSVAQLEILW